MTFSRSLAIEVCIEVVLAVMERNPVTVQFMVYALCDANSRIRSLKSYFP